MEGANSHDILLIEDNPGDADLVREHLPGTKIVHVATLAQARSALDEATFGVVLLDLALPDASGLEGVIKLRDDHGDTPIIVLTGLDDAKLGDEAIAHGAQDYLPKGMLDGDRLTRAVRYAMGRARVDRRLRSVVVNNVDAMLVVGAEDGIVKLANRAAVRMFGTDPTGTTFGYPLDEQSVSEIEINTGSVLRAGEMRVAHVDEWDGAPAYVASIRDITDRRRAEDLQNRLIHSDRLAAIGQLAAGVAHEVNNPAQYLLANFQQLEGAVRDIEAVFKALRGRKLQPLAGQEPERIDDILKTHDVEDTLRDVRDMAADNRDGVKRIVEIVKDLRSFSRIDMEQTELVNVNDAIKVATSMTANEIRHRAKLVTDFGDVPFIVADRGKLCQVFTNLLLNAAQAIQEGAASSNEIRVTTRQERNCIRVSVEDSGCGVPEAIRGQHLPAVLHHQVPRGRHRLGFAVDRGPRTKTRR